MTTRPRLYGEGSTLPFLAMLEGPGDNKWECASWKSCYVPCPKNRDTQAGSDRVIQGFSLISCSAFKGALIAFLCVVKWKKIPCSWCCCSEFVCIMSRPSLSFVCLMRKSPFQSYPAGNMIYLCSAVSLSWYQLQTSDRLTGLTKSDWLIASLWVWVTEFFCGY